MFADALRFMPSKTPFTTQLFALIPPAFCTYPKKNNCLKNILLVFKLSVSFFTVNIEPQLKVNKLRDNSILCVKNETWL